MASHQVVIFNSDMPITLNGISSYTGRLVAKSLLFPLEKQEADAWRENNYAITPFVAAPNELRMLVEKAKEQLIRCTYYKDHLGIVVAAAIGPADGQTLAEISDGLREL